MTSVSETALPSLLSIVLIGFALEVDRDFARAIEDTGLPAPSLSMYAHVMRFVGEAGVDVRRLPQLSGVSKEAIRSSLAGLERWGYVVVEPDAGGRLQTVRVTAHGRRAQEVWEHVLPVVEQRWAARFGERELDVLREALRTIADRLDPGLPHFPVTLPHRGGHPTGA